MIASDASFADDPDDRKSSQGYIVLFCGGPIAWKAGKQTVVTGSSTKAELLAFSTATKEVMQLSRIFNDVRLDLGLNNEAIPIACDNKQAIRLITHEGLRL